MTSSAESRDRHQYAAHGPGSRIAHAMLARDDEDPMKLICFGLLLVVCQPVDEPAQVTVAVCPEIASWSAAYQRRLASELRRLPSESAIERAVAEAINLRDQARACRANVSQ